MKNKLQLFLNKLLQSETFPLQVFQLLRYLGFVIVGIFFAKLGIPKSEIATFEKFLWVANLFSFFWVIGIFNSLIAGYSSLSAESKLKKIHTTFFTLLIFAAISTSIFLLFSFFFSSAFSFPTTLIWILGAYILWNSCSYLIEYIFFLQNRKRALILYGFAQIGLLILFCVLPLFLQFSISQITFFLIYIAGLKFLFLLYLLPEKKRISFQINEVKSFVVLAFPLMLSFLITGSAEYIDGFFVNHFFTDADFTIFRYGSRDIPLFTILSSTLSLTLIKNFVQNNAHSLLEIKEKTRSLMHIQFAFTLIFMFISPIAFTLVFNQGFRESSQIFNAVLLLTIPRFIFPQAILLGYQKNKVILMAVIAEFFANILFSFIGLKMFGLVGVIYGSLVAFLVEKIIQVLYLKIKFEISLQSYIPLKLLGIYSFILCIFYVLSVIYFH